MELPLVNADEVNSALTYYFDVGDVCNPQTRALLGLFAHIAHEPAFNQLRTVEQLGYIVSTAVWGSSGSIGWRLVVQSEKNPAYLENRVDLFFETTLKKLLEDMTDEEFEHKRQSLIDKKLEKFKNLNEESTSFWSQITSGYHDFFRRELRPSSGAAARTLTGCGMPGTIDADELKKVTRQDVIRLFMAKIHPASRDRSKLSLHMQSQKAPGTRVSYTAALIYLKAVKAKDIYVDEPIFHGFMKTEPPLEFVRSFWAGHFRTLLPDLSQNDAEELIKTLERAVRIHPPTNVDDQGRLSEDAVLVRDMTAFKAGLMMSKAPTPVTLYNDVDAKL